MKSRFDAFISYRHVSDGAFAAEFEVHLKRYAKSPLQSPRRIFRDEQHVRPGEDLSRTIQKALEGASYLILLASPEGAKSQWVRKEMDVWCGELGRADRIIIVLTDGEIALTEDGQSLDWSRTTALPPNLQGHLTNLPLWVDLRGFDESSLRQLGEPRYRAAINAIVARLEDQDPNRLSGVEWKIRRRNQQIAWSAASIMAILLAASIYSAFALFRSNTNLEHALKVSQSREYAATSRLQGMPMAMESAIAAVRAEPTREAVRALLDVMSGNRALRRHIARAHDAVETLAVSEDGQLLFYPDTGAAAPAITVMGADGTSLGRISLTDAGRVWDISMSGPHLYVLSDNGVWIAQADCMCAEKLFDISNDAFLTKLEAMDDRLILGGADGRLFAYSLSDKALLPVDDMQAALSDIASHDGMFAVAATTSDRSVRVWMAGASEPRDVEGIGERAVNAIVFSPDGRYLAGAFEQWSVAVWSVPELTLLWESDLEDNGSAVAFSPDSDLLAAGSNAGDISVFNLEWGDSEDSFTAIRGGVWELAWLDEGLISAGSDGWLKLWDPITPGTVATPLPPADDWTIWNNQPVGLLDDHALFLSDNGAERQDWDVGTVVEASSGTVLSLRNGTLFANRIGPDRSIKTQAFPEPPDGFRMHAASLSADGRLAAVAWWPLVFDDQIGRVAVWDTEADGVVWMTETMTAPSAMAFSAQGKIAVTGGGTIAVHDTTSGQLLHGGATTLGQAPIEEVAFLGEDVLYAGGLMGTLQRLSLGDNVTETASSSIPVGTVRDLTVLDDGSVIQVDVDGVRWFDAELNYLGPLLTTNERQVSAWSTTLYNRQSTPHLLVTLQADQAVTISLDLEEWISAAATRSAH